jgi:2-polyprenyl-3-methyl-5-hydroxy-6-metoxy-1,4-benzoquinol methylase
VILLFLLFWSQVPGQSHHGHHRDAAEWKRILEDPSRDAWQKPHEVVMALSLRAGETIADIGAGSGYFSRRFARHAGTVYAEDIDPKLIELLQTGAPKNVQTVLGSPDDPKLPPAALDTVFICDVLHHIENRTAYYPKLKAALKPGGRIVIVDFHKRPLPVGPPPAMKIEEADVVRELAAAGFTLTKKWEMLPHQYFLEFRVK